MPFYFAYGANLDTRAMAARCPGASVVEPARLVNHRFLIMRDGYASVRPARGHVVHGLLWRIAPADVGPLDAFEEVEAGLYGKVVHPVMRTVGSAQAFLYVGHTTEEGVPRPGYLEAIVMAARALAMPDRYVRSLAAWGRGMGDPVAAAERGGSPMGVNVGVGPVSEVRPRYATPFDRPSASPRAPLGRTPPRRCP